MCRSVLIVDDHASFRRLARRVLEAGGFDVIGEAADGKSALTEVARLRPQLVLLDIVLPDVDGLTVAARLAAAPDPPRVVLVSSRDATELGTRLEHAQASGFLQKDELSASALAALAGEES